MSEELLTEEEAKTLSLLADAWNSFLELEELHSDHVEEFRRAIHAAQYIVMVRPVARKSELEKEL